MKPRLQSFISATAPTPCHGGSLAQPFRFLAHNGEINTLQGNVNFMRAREAVLESTLWGDEIGSCCPSFNPAAATRQRSTTPLSF
jgi:glutamate synthase domain-containing protein 1